MDNESIDDLVKLEDRDIQIKKKEKKNRKIEEDDCFYRVKLLYNNYSKICKCKIPHIVRGELLVLSTEYGNEIGIVQGAFNNIEEIQSEEEIITIVRICNKDDRAKYRLNLKKEKEAYDVTIKKINEHNLNMKLINVHYFLEESKVLFNFTADGRVDFRDLVKDLASIFKTRIELRQIGVRDECRIIGGYGQCGKSLCCSGMTNELQPITIKMAKEQNITLNSLKISGVCGRLLCCLSYENDTYIQEKKRYPEENSRIKVNNDSFYVNEVNIQSGIIKIVSQKGDRVLYVNSSEIDYDYSKKTGVYYPKTTEE